MMFKRSTSLDNSSAKAITVLIEPWGQSLTLEKGQSLTVTAESEIEGEFEVRRLGDRIELYLWTGCTSVVATGSEEVARFDVRVPGIPPGMSMSGFVGKVFKDPPPKLPATTEPKIPWWKFWSCK